MHIFNLIRHCLLLSNGYANFHLQQQCRRVSVALYAYQQFIISSFWVAASLIGLVKWIWFSIITSKDKVTFYKRELVLIHYHVVKSQQSPLTNFDSLNISYVSSITIQLCCWWFHLLLKAKTTAFWISRRKIDHNKATIGGKNESEKTNRNQKASW